MTQNLLNALEDLRDHEFKDFRWYLQQPDIVEPYHTIKVSKLERAERRDTVDLMVNAYKPHGALMVTKKVLEKIYRNDLVQRLLDTSSGPEGQSQLNWAQLVQLGNILIIVSAVKLRFRFRLNLKQVVQVLYC